MVLFVWLSVCLYKVRVELAQFEEDAHTKVNNLQATDVMISIQYSNQVKNGIAICW